MRNYDILEKIKKENYPIFMERIKNDDKYIVSDDSVTLAGDFYQKQTRIILKNYDVILPESIEEYIVQGGYLALEKAIFDMKPIDIVNVVLESNLRGRGGGGFPTGKKWRLAYQTESEQKYIICNADEGEPGACMDRSIMEGDPHSVLEAMAIAGRAIGADKGYIYVRAEYPEAVEMLEIGISKAKELNLLGDNILGSDFSFDIELKLGMGDFVCGEETALIRSIEGYRGTPQFKFYPTAQKGLFSCPTVVNNVETFANIPHIIMNGADWYKSMGTEDTPGTKVFALAGKIKNTGLVEVPMGKSINEILFDIGAGIPDDKKVKAIHTGSSSGGCIPPELFDTKIDFGSLEKIGSILGSGSVIVMDEEDCVVDITKSFVKFSVDESCGKCTPCRIGNKRVLEILDRITSGKAGVDDLERLEDLCDVVTNSSFCGLGKTSTAPVTASMRFFIDEYKEHVEGFCRASSCRKLLKYYITDKCVGCGACKSVCPVAAISGEKRTTHFLDTALCVKCNSCFDRCPVKAIVKK